jgi:hypothetical protein
VILVQPESHPDTESDKDDSAWGKDRRNADHHWDQVHMQEAWV